MVNYCCVPQCNGTVILSRLVFPVLIFIPVASSGWIQSPELRIKGHDIEIDGSIKKRERDREIMDEMDKYRREQERWINTESKRDG